MCKSRENEESETQDLRESDTSLRHAKEIKHTGSRGPEEEHRSKGTEQTLKTVNQENIQFKPKGQNCILNVCHVPETTDLEDQQITGEGKCILIKVFQLQAGKER